MGSMTRVEERVTCAFCEPIRRWWSRHPRASYRHHLREFHLAEWDYLIKVERNELLAAIDNATMMRVA